MSENNRVVSIVMPVHNGEEFLHQAINSVIDQTHSFWELIVVDDGSQDSTAQIIASFANTEQRIRSVYQPNQGQAAALNHGLTLVRGEYITTLDADDWLTKDSLQARVTFLEAHPQFGAVYGDGYYCDVQGTPLGMFSQHLQQPVSGDVYEVLLGNSFFGTGSNVMVRKAIFDQFELKYDTSIKYCQDYDLYVRIAARTQFGAVSVPTVWYRIHETNMTQSMSSSEKNANRYKAIKKILASKRFSRASSNAKTDLLYRLLVDVLAFNSFEQKIQIDSRHFKGIPEQQQARVLRIVANDYVSLGGANAEARDFLKLAITANPRDWKTRISAWLLSLSPMLAGAYIKFWRWLMRRKVSVF